MEAIVLAGGLGTRLRSAVSDLPKAMAPIHGRPFLETLLDYLIKNGVTRIILSVGYKSEAIVSHFGEQYKNCELVYSKEETPLGTGGGIALAMKLVRSKHVIVANGDSFLLADFGALMKSHAETKADISLSLKPMKNFSRYGTVRLNDANRIISFEEKRNIDEGVINGGLYVFNVASFLGLSLPESFSLEKEVFENRVNELYINGVLTQGYFIDIGIPTDFQKAQIELGCLLAVDKDWTLFLDRDGVINRKIDNDYVRNLSQFEILPGVIEAIANFSKFFGRIVVVTNQQGVGKGLMTAENVDEIHDSLLTQVKDAGGQIDAFYFAPQLVSEQSNMRKPNAGMALKAQKDFPTIDFNKSIMVGDSISDMQFAQNAGMPEVFLTAGTPHVEYYSIASLPALATTLSEIKMVFNK